MSALKGVSTLVSLSLLGLTHWLTLKLSNRALGRSSYTFLYSLLLPFLGLTACFLTDGLV
jgi:hypothetical protein